MIELLILLLSVYGTSKLLVEYDGPMDVFYRLRANRYLKMLLCVVCTACYVSLAFFIIYWLGYVMWLTPLAIVGAIILIEEKL